MASEAESSVQYFIKSLVEQSDELEPIMKQLHDGIADVPYQDLYMLRQHLVRVRSSISLLDSYNTEVLEERKPKRRFNPFKK